MADKKEKRGLGRGLSALMADVDISAQTGLSEAPAAPRAADQLMPVEKIYPNPDQPRRQFDPDGLDELANSIREKGIIQPLIVRKDPTAEGQYQIVAGERRWRAAQLARQHEVPVIIREFDDLQVLEIAIIENIQREDLNAVDEAMGYRQLQQKFGHTQEQLSEALGKSRSHIANLMRLLQLPDDVLNWIKDGKLSAGHARALITAEDPVALAKEVIRKNLSVRETEKLVKKGSDSGKKTQSSSSTGSEKDADTIGLQNDIKAALGGMPVSIDHRRGTRSGTMTITYRNFDDLDELVRLLFVQPKG